MFVKIIGGKENIQKLKHGDAKFLPDTGDKLDQFYVYSTSCLSRQMLSYDDVQYTATVTCRHMTVKPES